MRASLDNGLSLATPDGILFNGHGPEEAFFAFQPGIINVTLNILILSQIIHKR